MAAITRALFPQLFFHSLKPVTRNLPLPFQTRPKARTVSKYARLQPVFPDKPDENLFEPFSEEYRTSEDVVSTVKVEKAHPCDVLAAAADSGDLALAESLLEEYTTAKIDIAHRPVYTNLARASVQHGDVNSMLKWLALVPSAQEKHGLQHPPNDEDFVELMNTNRMLFDRMMQLLHLYCFKGWSGPVLEQLVGTLATFIPQDEFLRTFSHIINVREKSIGTSADERALIAHLRCLAIHNLAARSNPEAAWHLLREDFDGVLEMDQAVIVEVFHAARRTGSSIAALLRQIEIDRALDILDKFSLHDRGRLKSRTLTTLAFQLENLEENVSRRSRQRLIQQTASALRSLKRVLINHAQKPDPKAVAYLLLALTKTASPHDFVALFRKRTSRLGNPLDKSFWGTVEFELLCLQDDSHSAVSYYYRAFNTSGAPTILQGAVESPFWDSWLSKTPARRPPIPPSRFNPSFASRFAIWKAAITLSTRDPASEAKGSFTSLVKSEDGENFNYDTTHFRQLFKNFLDIFDRNMRSRRAAFSNVYTRARFFELFLKKATDIDPEFCSDIMAAMQQRDVLLDHRVWFAYAKHKVLNGEPEFLLKIIHLLEQDSGRPDFSPTALRDYTAHGRKMGGINTLRDVYMAHKVFSAYTYAYKQLLDAKAYREALQLHDGVLAAGYVAGSSIPFDRLTYRLMEEMQTRIQKARLEAEPDSNSEP